MSDSLPSPWPEETLPDLFLLPVLHDRLEVTGVVREVLDRLDPQGVAVELPERFRPALKQAIARLPLISLLIAHSEGGPVDIWVASPGEPFVEALRWAQERKRPIFLIDPDIAEESRHRDAVPDPWSLWETGAESYFTLLEDALEGTSVPVDERREQGMAWALQQAREQVEGPLLALVGAAHRRSLAAKLVQPAAVPFAPRKKAQVEVRHLHPRDLTALLRDPPSAHGIWERLRQGKIPDLPTFDSAVDQPVSVVRAGLRLIEKKIGADGDDRRISRSLDWLAANTARHGLAGAMPFPDQRKLEAAVWRLAGRQYETQTRLDLQAWQRRLYFDFLRRYIRIQGSLVGGLWEWTMAGRGVADDNLAWEIFEVGRTYPWQKDKAEIPTVSLDGDELDLGTRKVRFRRRFMRVKSRPRLVPVKKRPTLDPEEWLKGFEEGGLCSYPPEDIRVEDWGRFLRRRGRGQLEAERTKVEPFSTSFFDGIDIRETLRHVEDERIWVRERGRIKGEVGSVVVIFDRDEERRFPFKMTWMGEHEQESDMAFYATNPSDQLVGPGIMRATYGGFVMTMPPGRLAEVWTDPEYLGLPKHEVLLHTAIDYCEERWVVHVAAKAPAPHSRAFAESRGKSLVHVPLGALSPGTLKKVRVVHLLIGHDKREIARDNVW